MLTTSKGCVGWLVVRLDIQAGGMMGQMYYLTYQCVW